MALVRNVVGWFEIPATDMERAIQFFQTVFNCELERIQMDSLDMALFPMVDKPGASGALVQHEEFYKPSHEGTLIYFSSQTGDLNHELGKVENAGGKVLQKKTKISDEHGFMALFEDTEGNRLALHSRT